MIPFHSSTGLYLLKFNLNLAYYVSVLDYNENFLCSYNCAVGAAKSKFNGDHHPLHRYSRFFIEVQKLYLDLFDFSMHLAHMHNCSFYLINLHYSQLIIIFLLIIVIQAHPCQHSYYYRHFYKLFMLYFINNILYIIFNLLYLIFYI